MRTDANHLSLPVVEDRLTLGELIAKRWRAVAGPAILWATVGSIAGSAFALPSLTGMIEQQGHLAWLIRGIAPGFISAFILIVALCMSVSSGAEMARRPFWFLTVAAIGSALSTGTIMGLDMVFPAPNIHSKPNRLLDGWLTIMLFCCFFGWAAVLNVKRSAEQKALTELLMRRSLLARQVAQARLFAARAQVDPEMVARVLSRVRTQYRADAVEAGVLLDQLIAYLRLAMNRQGVQHPLLGGELEMMRGYATLRQAETGAQIDLQISLEPGVQQQQPAAAPFFLLVRQFLREGAPRPVMLQLRIDVAELRLIMETGIPLPEDALARLHTGLREIFAGNDQVAILHHLLDTGVHRYVVQAAID